MNYDYLSEYEKKDLKEFAKAAEEFNCSKDNVGLVEKILEDMERSGTPSNSIFHGKGE